MDRAGVDPAASKDARRIEGRRVFSEDSAPEVERNGRFCRCVSLPRQVGKSPVGCPPPLGELGGHLLVRGTERNALAQFGPSRKRPDSAWFDASVTRDACVSGPSDRSASVRSDVCTPRHQPLLSSQEGRLTQGRGTLAP
jgi:hypothetical protein